MTKRIFRSICLAVAAVLLASLVLITGALYASFSELQERQLKTQIELVANGVTHEGEAYFHELVTADSRLTWIAADGRVLYDSSVNAAEMENHLNREEVQQALKTGYGQSQRYSSTLTERFLYIAKRLPDGTVIRLSGRQDTVLSLLADMLPFLLAEAVLAFGLSFLLAHRLSKKVVEPLNSLNLDKPLSNRDYDELNPVLRRLDSQQKQLKQQEATLRRKQEEFEAAANNMDEGLVLLSRQGQILSINPTAARLLAVDHGGIGQDILFFNHSLALQELLRRAGEGEHAETAMALGEQEYQLNASPVISDGDVTGVVLLIFDVTEKEKAEQLRREFTANVSHELKTPLHTISGYAELMKDGMVRPEDIAPFAGRIYGETQRLIALVEDIIRLSHLDEGAVELQWEQVDLYEVARRVLHALEPKAKAAAVAITLQGQPAVITGVPQLLETIVFNLCDNAIKYNRQNGSVSVDLRNEDDALVLTVSDTGIGIPPEHRERVFERFYRVDKSHSKEVGGTGLGLSIVKHAAKIHRAAVTLNSVTDGGTVVTVTFPKQGE